MKLIAIACFAAVAFAEPEADAKADPALLYGAYGYAGVPAYTGYGYSNLGYGYNTLGYAAHGYSAYSPYTYTYGKRSADAEPEADPALLYGTYGYTGLRPFAGYGYSNLGYGYNTLGYATHGYTNLGYSAYNPYTYTYGKRSADAEPEADADAALLYGTYGYAGLPATTYGAYRAYNAYPAYTGYGYNNLFGYSAYGAYPYLG